MNKKPTHYSRIILKLSGESFCSQGERGVSMDEVIHIAQQIKLASELGCQIAVVIGGGNILRGSQFKAANAVVQPSGSTPPVSLKTPVRSTFASR